MNMNWGNDVRKTIIEQKEWILLGVKQCMGTDGGTPSRKQNQCWNIHWAHIHLIWPHVNFSMPAKLEISLGSTQRESPPYIHSNVITEY